MLFLKRILVVIWVLVAYLWALVLLSLQCYVFIVICFAYSVTNQSVPYYLILVIFSLFFIICVVLVNKLMVTYTHRYFVVIYSNLPALASCVPAASYLLYFFLLLGWLFCSPDLVASCDMGPPDLYQGSRLHPNKVLPFEVDWAPAARINANKFPFSEYRKLSHCHRFLFPEISKTSVVSDSFWKDFFTIIPLENVTLNVSSCDFPTGDTLNNFIKVPTPTVLFKPLGPLQFWADARVTFNSLLQDTRLCVSLSPLVDNFVVASRNATALTVGPRETYGSYLPELYDNLKPNPKGGFFHPFTTSTNYAATATNTMKYKDFLYGFRGVDVDTLKKMSVSDYSETYGFRFDGAFEYNFEYRPLGGGPKRPPYSINSYQYYGIPLWNSKFKLPTDFRSGESAVFLAKPIELEAYSSKKLHTNFLFLSAFNDFLERHDAIIFSKPVDRKLRPCYVAAGKPMLHTYFTGNQLTNLRWYLSYFYVQTHNHPYGAAYHDLRKVFQGDVDLLHILEVSQHAKIHTQTPGCMQFVFYDSEWLRRDFAHYPMLRDPYNRPLVEIKKGIYRFYIFAFLH